MILRLAIRSYKSIKDLEVEFGKITLFIGPNGSGKSAIIELIMMLK